MQHWNLLNRRTFCKYAGMAGAGILLDFLPFGVGVVRGSSPDKKIAYPIPGRPIKHICHQKAGAFVAASTQKILPVISKYLGGNPFSYEEQTGAGGRIAYTMMYNAQPDGYTTMTAMPEYAIVGELSHDVKYKSRELTWVHSWVRIHYFINVKKSGSYQNFDDLLQASKKKKVFFAGDGAGALTHLQALLLKKSGLIFEDVQFDGIASAQAAVMGGHTDFFLASGSQTKRSLGEVTPLAVIAEERETGLPDVPTVNEVGHPTQAIPLSWGMGTSPKVPAEIVDVLQEANAKAVKDPEMTEFFRQNGTSVYIRNRQEWTADLDRKYGIFSELIKDFKKEIQG